MSRGLLLSLLLASCVASAQIYKTTDEQGNVVFTDTPPADTNAERIEVRSPNTTPPPPPVEAAPQPASEEQENVAVEFSVAITAPDNETTIPMGPGNFSVSARVAPALAQEEALQLYLDDEPWGEPQQATDWDLTNVFRGAHDLTVAVLDVDGNRLAISTPVRVYVMRPSVNFRGGN